jgi:hypothetical protein
MPPGPGPRIDKKFLKLFKPEKFMIKSPAAAYSLPACVFFPVSAGLLCLSNRPKGPGTEAFSPYSKKLTKSAGAGFKGFTCQAVRDILISVAALRSQ